MAREPKRSAPVEESSDNRQIILSAPIPDSEFSYLASSVDKYVLNFDPKMASFNRVGDALEIRFDNGSVIFLIGYFAEDNVGLPSFETQDGSLLSGTDLTREFSSPPEVATAGGPDQQTQAVVNANQANVVSGLNPESETQLLEAESPEEEEETPDLLTSSHSLTTLSSSDTLLAPAHAPETPSPDEPAVFNQGAEVQAAVDAAATAADAADPAIITLRESLTPSLDGENLLTIVAEAGQQSAFPQGSDNQGPDGQSLEGQNLEGQNPDGQTPENQGQNQQTLVSLSDDSLGLNALDAGALFSPDQNSALPDTPSLTDQESSQAALPDGAEQDSPLSIPSPTPGQDPSDQADSPVSPDQDSDLPGGSTPQGSGVGEYRLNAADIGGTASLSSPSPSDEPISGTTFSDVQRTSVNVESATTESFVASRSSIIVSDAPADLVQTVYGEGPGGAVVYEAGLSNGTSPGTGNVSAWQQMVLPSGVAVVGVARGGVGIFEDEYGTLTIRHLIGNTYQYRYQLTSSYAKGENESSDTTVDARIISFPVTNGVTTSNASIAVDIVDDKPVVSLVQTGESGNSVIGGGEVTGSWSVNFGADGEYPSAGLLATFSDGNATLDITVQTGELMSVVIDDVDYGTIEFLEDGRYIFKTNAGASATLTMTLKATDGDGDTTTAESTFIIKAPSGIEDYAGLGLEGDVLVSEAGLASGSDSGNGLSASVPLPEGYTLVLEGHPWVPQQDTDGNDCYVLTGELGQLTYYPAGEEGGTPELIYTLLQNAAHRVDPDNPDSDDIYYDLSFGSFIFEDSRGIRYEVESAFKIQDDQPEIDFGQEGGAPGIDLNVGDTFNTGFWHVEFGADGARPDGGSLFLSASLAGGETAISIEVPADFSPIPIIIDNVNYGSLILNEDRTFTFIANDNTGELSFVLSAVDSDGDTVSSSAFNIRIDDGPEIPYLGYGQVFNEANLENGTNHDPGLTYQTIALPEGYRVDVSEGWLEHENNMLVKVGAKGYLYASADGSSLHYQLTGNVANNGDNTVEHTDSAGWDVFPEIRLLGENNKEVILDARIEISDDVPLVTFGGDNSETLIVGESFSGDWTGHFGADEAAADTPIRLVVTVDGKNGTFPIEIGEAGSAEIHIDGKYYGRLTLNEDNTFTYQTDDSMADCKEIGFSLALTDGDGDTALSNNGADFTLQVHREISFPAVTVNFNEANLKDGTAADPDALQQAILLPEGYRPVLDSSWDNSDGTYVLNTETGFFTYEQAQGLSFTLTAPVRHSAQGKDTLDLSLAELKIVSDTEGTATIRIEAAVKDDAPLVNLGSEDGGRAFVLIPGESFESGVWDINFGADGPARDESLILTISLVDGGSETVSIGSEQASHAIVIDGNFYGTLTLKPDNTFSYDATSANTGQLDLVLTANDNDGDTVQSGKLSITIKEEGGPDIPYLGYGHLVKESYHENGTEAGQGETLQYLSVPNGYTIDISDNEWTEHPDEAGQYIRQSEFGSLVTDATGSWLAYVVNNAVPGGDGNYVDRFSDIRLLDSNNEPHYLPARVEILDDAPTAGLSGDNDTPVILGETFTGHWQALFGADGPADEGLKPYTLIATIAGKEHEFSLGTGEAGAAEILVNGVSYGSFILNEDNTFSYVAPSNAPNGISQIGFTLSLTDGDGDTTFSNNGNAYIIALREPAPLDPVVMSDAFDEALLEGGSKFGEGSPSQSFRLADGYRPVLDNWDDLDGTYRLDVENGYFTYDAGSGDIVFTLTSPVAHDLQNPDSKSLTLAELEVSNANGVAQTLLVQGTVLDDAPEAFFGLTGAEAGIIEEGAAFQGNWSHAFGADGPAESGALSLSVRLENGEAAPAIALIPGEDSSHEIVINNVAYGTLNINADGSYAFQSLSGASGVLEFELAAADSDGDVTPSGSFKLTILEDDGPVVTEIVGTATESYGPEGSDERGDDEAGMQEIPLPEGYTIDTSIGGWVEDANNPGVWVLVDREINYGGLVTDTAGTVLGYRSGAAYKHSGEEEAFDYFAGVYARKGDGESFNLPVRVNILDDAPLAGLSGYNTEAISYGLPFTGQWEGVFGIDGQGETGLRPMRLTAFIEDETYEFKIGTGSRGVATITVDGVGYGTVTLNEDGTFVYQSLEGMPKIANIGFVLSLTDGDGSTTISNGGEPFVISLRAPDALEPISFENAFNEAFLEGGSRADEGSLSQTFRLADGFSPVLDGWDEVDGIHTLAVANGILSYNADSGDFTYTLTSPLAHQAQGADDRSLTLAEISVRATDGDVHTQRIQGTVTDDVPTAFFGLDGSDAATMDEATVFQGNWNHVFGADGPAGSEALILNVRVDGGRAAPPITLTSGQNTSHDIIINSVNYGTLNIKADGSYEFLSVKGVPGVLLFALSAKDSDGDEALSESFKLTIQENDGPAETEILGTAYESYAPGGSDENGTTEGLQPIALPEGFSIDLDQGGWGEDRNSPGTYVLNGDSNLGQLVTDAEGSALYYRAITAGDHADDEPVFDLFSGVHVLNEAQKSFSLPVKVEIIDDAPIADLSVSNDDLVIEYGHAVAGEWEGLFGADGPAESGPRPMQLMVSIDGGQAESVALGVGSEGVATIIIGGNEYGTFTLNEDNTFVYQSLSGMPEIANIGFVLSLTDSDGDTTLSGNGEPFVVNLRSSTPLEPVTINGVFDEAFLAGGSMDGEGSPSRSFHLADGYSPVLDDDWREYGDAYRMEAENGFLIYNAENGEITFTLTSPVAHTSQDMDVTTITLAEIKVSTEGGQPQTLLVQGAIKDDVPEAFFGLEGAGSGSIDEGATFEGAWNYTFGADGPANAGALSLSVNLDDGKTAPLIALTPGEDSSHEIVIDNVTYGTLNINADGSFEFLSLEGADGALHFTLSARDFDGDRTASNTFTLTIQGSGGPVETEILGTAFEAAAPGGTANSGGEDVLQEISLPEGYTIDLGQGGWTEDGQGSGIYLLTDPENNLGTLITDSSGSVLGYRVDGATGHTDDEPVYDLFPGVYVRNEAGKSYSLPVKVQLLDDQPIADLSGDNEEALTYGQSFTGFWEGLFGADGPAENGPEPMQLLVSIDGAPAEAVALGVGSGGTAVIAIGGEEYGTFTLGEDGRFVYQSLPDMPEIENIGFVLSLTDNDGDTTFSGNGEPFVLNMRPQDIVDPINLEGVLDEAFLEGGTKAGEDSLSQSFHLADGYSPVLDNWQEDSESEGGIYHLEVKNGLLTYDAETSQITFTLTSAVAHSEQGADEKLVTLAEFEVSNTDGSTVLQRVLGTVKDDAPEAFFGLTGADSGSVDEGAAFQGNWNYAFGADRQMESDPLTLSVSLEGGGAAPLISLVPGQESVHTIVIGDVTYGTLSVNADGGYEFASRQGASGVLEFRLSVADSDGDVAESSPFKLTIQNDGGPDETEILGTAYESHAPGGTAEPGEPGEENLQEIALPQGFSIDLDQGGWVKDENAQGTYVLAGGSSGLGELVTDAEGSVLYYRATAAADHTDNEPVYDYFSGVHVLNEAQKSFSLPVQVEILDDAPIADLSGDNSAAINYGQPFTGQWQGLFGADGAAESGARPMQLLVSIDGGQAEPVALGAGPDGAATITINGQEYGTFTLNEDGSFVYQSLNGMPEIENIGFVLSLTDNDGDTTLSGNGEPFVVNLRAPGPVDVITIDGAFDEAFLADGSKSGEGDPSRSFRLAEGYSPVLEDWDEVDGLYLLEADNGIFTYDAEKGDFTFTLTSPVAHDVQGSDSIQLLLAAFDVRDANGMIQTQLVQGTIIDDAPWTFFGKAEASSGTVNAGETFNGTWSHTFGADGAADSGALFLVVGLKGGETASPIELVPGQDSSSPVVIDNVTYGTLNINADGSYEFLSLSGASGVLEFTLSATDSEGDLARSDTFSLGIHAEGAPPVTEIFGSATEAYGPDGSDERGDSLDGMQVISLPEGFTIDVSQGRWEEDASNPGAYILVDRAINLGGLVTNAEGTMLAYRTGTGSNHSNGDIYDYFSDVYVLNAENKAFNLPVRVQILDDQPLADLSGDNGEPVVYGQAFTGKWVGVFGVDGQGMTGLRPMVLLVTIDGEEHEVRVGTGSRGVATITINNVKYGTFTLNEDGSFVYQSLEDMPAIESIGFALSLTDGDGSTTVSHDGDPFVITLREPYPVEPIRIEGAFNEAYLEDGSLEGYGNLTRSFTLAEGYSLDLDGWEDADGLYLLEVDKGILSYDEINGEITFTLTTPQNHSESGVDSRTLTLAEFTVRDSQGNLLPQTLMGTVIDDIPATSFSDNEDNRGAAVRGGESFEGTWEALYGADGPAASGNLTLAVSLDSYEGATVTYAIPEGQSSHTIAFGNITYGTLNIEADGTYTFISAATARGMLSFVLTAKDGDGDVSASEAFRINITDADAPDIPYLGYGYTVKESYFTGGTEEKIGQQESLQYLSVPEGFRIDIHDGGWTHQGDGFYVLQSLTGGLVTDANGSMLAYMVGRAVNHNGSDMLETTGSSAIDVFNNIKLISDSGDTHYIDARIEIINDTPIVDLYAPNLDQLTVGEAIEGTWTGVYGADGPATNSSMLFTLSVAGKNYDFVIGEDMAADLVSGDLNFGHVEFRDDGSFIYTSNAAMPDADEIGLSLSLVTSEGTRYTSNNGEAIYIPLRTPDAIAPVELGTFNEAWLEDGTSAGGGALSRTFDLPDGYSLVLTDGWVPQNNSYILQVESGYFSYSEGSNRMSYTMTTAVRHSGEGADSRSNATLAEVTVRGTEGDEIPLRITASIVDDIPVVSFGSKDDSPLILDHGDSYIGGLWSVDYGADHAASSGSLVLRVTLVGAGQYGVINVDNIPGEYPVSIGGKSYGTVAFNTDNSFSFKAGDSNTGELSFTLTATDGDGDRVSINEFNLVIQEAGGPDIPYLGYGESFNEANLEDGSNPMSGMLARYISVPAGFTVDLTDWSDHGDGTYIMMGTKGVLSCKADGTGLAYMLTSGVRNNGSDSVEHDGDVGYDLIPNITLISQTGKSYTLNAKIAIADDAPTVAFGGNNEDPVGFDEVFEGTWQGHFGSDGAASRSPMTLTVKAGNVSREFSLVPEQENPVDLIINGQNYGTIVLKTDGTYTYQQSESMPDVSSISFVLSLTDGDGDTAKSNNGQEFTLLLLSKTDIAPIVLAAMDEANLPGGTDESAAALVRTFSLPDDCTLVLSNWTLENGQHILQVKNGYLGYNQSSGQLSYTLTSPLAHNEPGGSLDLTIGYIQVAKGDGDVQNVKITTTVLDDTPVLEALSGNNDTLGANGGGFSSSGTLALDFGADGDSFGKDETFRVDLAYVFDNSGSQVTGTTSVYVPRNGSVVNYVTAMGKGVMYYDEENGILRYSYEAVRGRSADQEKITFSIVDSDGGVASVESSFTLAASVPGGGIILDEAGLSMGSNSYDSGPASASYSIDAASLQSNAVSISWYTGSAPSLRADGNLDGTYSTVTWTQSGNVLQGHAEGQLVMELVPKFNSSDVFTGEIQGIIYKPFDHSNSSNALELNFSFKQIYNTTGSLGSNASIKVVIKDDAPFGNTSLGQEQHNEAGIVIDPVHQQEVYLVMDMGVNQTEAISYVNAARALIAQYQACDSEVTFTVVSYAGGSSASKVCVTGASATDLLGLMTANSTGVTWLASGLSSGRAQNYTKALATTQSAIEASISNPETANADRAVYFLTSGAQSGDVNSFQNTWTPFVQSQTNMEVFAVAVGSSYSTAAREALVAVTGGESSHVQYATSWSGISPLLSSQYHEGRSTLFPDGYSADVCTITSVAYGEEGNAQTYSLRNTGDAAGLNTGEIPLGNGASIVIYADGTYVVNSPEKLSSDFSGKISLTLKDSDGDIFVTDAMDIGLESGDVATAQVAGDTVGQYDPGYDTPTLLGKFATSPTATAADASDKTWTGHNVTWAQSLTSGMAAIPVDDTLVETGSDGKLLKLTATSMTIANIQTHLGTNSLVALMDDLNIPANTSLVSPSGSSNVALASRTFSSSGGEVVFNWSFTGRYWNGDADAAFWVLMDAQGNIVDSGKISSAEAKMGVQYESGITHIQVPDSNAAQDYKLVLGTVNGGVQSSTAATLFVDTVAIVETPYDFKGNILDESSGNDDFASVASIVYKGATYNITGESLTIQLESGSLTVDRDGDYRLNLNNGVNSASVLEEIGYTLVDADNNKSSATLTLKGAETFAYDNLATQAHGYQNIELLSLFDASNSTSNATRITAALTNHGWTYAGSVTVNATPSSGALRPLPAPAIDGLLSSATSQVLLSTSTLTGTQLQSYFGTSEITSVASILNAAGVDSVYTFTSSRNEVVSAAVMQKSVTTSGGKLAFSWSFLGGTDAADNDAAFWLLKDQNGNIVQSGLLHQGKGAQNGTTYVDIAETDSERQYTLVMGMIEGGYAKGSAPQMLLGNVLLLEGEYHYSGNVIEDQSMDGQSDVAFYDTKLDSVTYDGQTKFFDSQNTVLEFSSSKGTLTIDWEGNYYYTARDGKPYSVSEEFSYTLEGAKSGNSGTVYIEPYAPYAPHLVPDYDPTLTTTYTEFRPSSFTHISGSNMTWSSSSFDKSWAPTVLQNHFDNNYFRIYGAGYLQPQRALILGNSDMSFQELLEMAGVEGQLYLPETPLGSFVSRQFTSTGGLVLFDFMGNLSKRADMYEMDATLWILRDENDNVISAGKMFQATDATIPSGKHYSSGGGAWEGGGVGVVSIPPSDEAKTYTLVIGSIQIGTVLGNSPELIIDSVVHVEAAFQFKGNIFDEIGADGIATRAGDSAIIGMIEYNGVEYKMDSSGVISLTTEGGGSLMIMYDGTYAYSDTSGDGRNVCEDIIYTILDPQDGGAFSGQGLYNQGVLSLRGDNYRVNGTAGDDIIDRSAHNTSDVINAGDGNDYILGGFGDEQIFGGEGNDTIYANIGSNRIYGGAGDDEIYGGTGSDTIYGGSGNDLILGGDGDDYLFGGTGENTMWGGNGADTFGWKSLNELAGKDVIMDFNASEGDKLGFELLFDTREDVDSYFRELVTNLNLNVNRDEMSFTIRDGSFAKEVEIHFNPEADNSYLSMKAAYVDAQDIAAQQEVLTQFLVTIANS